MSPDWRVRELLRRYLELREAGIPVSPEELCRDCPELLAELNRRIQEAQERDFVSDRTTRPETVWPTSGTGPVVLPAAGAQAPGMRYRPQRLHAKGGLGEVFVAEDLE